MTRIVWLDGRFINYEDAKVPILNHSLQYGSGIFEGIRSYRGDKTYIFRLDEHIDRFFNSMKIYNMPVKHSKEEIKEAIKELIRKNNLGDSYIRPFAFYNDDRIGLSVVGKSLSIYIAAAEFGKYLGEKESISVKTSSWRRINSAILPVKAKASGNYINSILANMEAKLSGFDEAIMLDQNGNVSEGSAENVFLVRKGVIYTPSISDSILEGITRDSVIKISKFLGYEVIETEIPREDIYISDEVFFTGTAAEITPVTNVDGIVIGDGKIGKITRELINFYSKVVRGHSEHFQSWLTEV